MGSNAALTSFLRDGFAARREAEQTGRPIEDVMADREARRLSRRQFLEGAGAAAALLAAGSMARPGRGPARPPGGSAPRIVIVGGGLAGLRCADVLWHRGFRSTIHEASGSVGGRCWTLRGFFDQGQIGEHGGESISSEHSAIRSLAADLGLALENTNRTPRGTKDIYSFAGAPYTVAEANADWFDAYPAFRRAVRSAPWPQRHDHHTPGGVRLDHTSVPEWLDANVPGGSAGRFGQLLMQDAISEYGADPGAQPALNLIYLLSGNPRRSLNPLAGTDEKYHVRGGNDQIVAGLAARLPAGTIRADEVLVALRRNANGTYGCTFVADGRTADVVADHVVLALPFTTLRDVDLSRAGFSPLKMTAIRSLNLGTNAKIHLQFTSRVWNALGYTGTTYTDTGAMVAWDQAVPQPGTAGLLVDFPGGTLGGTLGGPAHGIPPDSRVSATLAALEPVFPGVTSAYNGMAWQDWWAADPWHHGAYTYWGLGQYTGFSGIEGVREGNAHFCGEHTSYGFQGYMEGAVRTGARAANEILAG